MRKFIALFVILLPCCATMTTITFSEDDNVQAIYDDLTGTKEQLYLKSNAWMIEVFNDAESVIQHQDKEAGAIIGKYLLNGALTTTSGLYGTTVDTRVYAIIDIRLKDNKAMIEIKPQGSWQYDTSGMTVYNYSKEDAIKDMKSLAYSFHQAMLKEDKDF